MEITGRCLCGRVRFVYTGTLGTASYCHCDDCRRATGGPYTISVLVEKKHLTIENEALLKAHTCTGDSGRILFRLFCGECGSPFMTTHPERETLVWLKAGLFDRPELITPAHESWTSKKVPWATIRVGASWPENPH